jgi:IS5 family transposase
VVAIATASRHKGEEGEARRKKQYKELLRYSRQILNDTKPVLSEVEEMSAKKKKGLRGLCEHLSEMAGRVRQVVKQTKVRVFDGITQMPGKIVSLFEPHSEIIRKGKASKPTEFGELARISHAGSPSRENRGGKRSGGPISGFDEKTVVRLGKALWSQMLPAVCRAITGQ